VSTPRLTAAYDALTECVSKQGPEITFTVEQRDIERFAIASGDPDPIYFEERAARAAGLPGVVSPPLLMASIWEWGSGVRLDQLRPDGTGVPRDGWLPLDGLRLVGGGQALEFHAPASPGSEVVVRPTLEAVELKQGRSGPLVIVVVRSDFSSAAGQLLVSCRDTWIGREATADEEGG
jgi:acyl dehydratase